MNYCKLCINPDTKPDLTFNSEGICLACRSFKQRETINWEQRHAEFVSLVSQLKNSGLIYHCIVPVSGGKDSHYQILKCLEYGLNPLAVTATTDDLSNIG